MDMVNICCGLDLEYVIDMFIIYYNQSRMFVNHEFALCIHFIILANSG